MEKSSFRAFVDRDRFVKHGDKKLDMLWDVMSLLYEIRYRTPTSDNMGWSHIAGLQDDLHKAIDYYKEKYANVNKCSDG